MRSSTAILAIAMLAMASVAYGQGGRGGTGGAAGGAGGAGLTQTGTVTSSAALTRNFSGFAGRSSATVQNPRSRAGATGTSFRGTGTGGAGNTIGGGGLGGFGGGGLGGGLGGFGGGGLGGFGGGGFGGRGGFGGGGFGGGGRGGGQFGQQQFGRGNNNNNNQVRMRAPIRATDLAKQIKFSQRAVVVNTVFAARIKKIPTLTVSNVVVVNMAGRKAVLQGTVASDREKNLIARLALLEPGIDSVQNDLRVTPSSSSSNAKSGSQTGGS